MLIRFTILIIVSIIVSSCGNLDKSPSPTLTEQTSVENAPFALAERGVTSNAEWTPYIQAFDGVDMVLVPVGCFDMGNKDADSDEQPVHEICFDVPFWIDKTEATQVQFRQFNGVVGRASSFPGDNNPVENITWFEARDFCALRDARLPTEAEWEYSARGPDNLIYPWGNDFVTEDVVYDTNSNGQTAFVGSRAAGVSWVGALDLSGNVWEWISSQYQPYPYDASDGREADTGNGQDVLRVLRGGSWHNENTDLLRAGSRERDNPNNWNGLRGFRCVHSDEQ